MMKNKNMRIIGMLISALALGLGFNFCGYLTKCMASEYRVIMLINEDLDGDTTQNYSRGLLQGVVTKTGLTVVGSSMLPKQGRINVSASQQDDLTSITGVARKYSTRFVIVGDVKTYRNRFPVIEPLKSCRATLSMRVIDVSRNQVIWTGNATEGGTDANYPFAARVAVKNCLDVISRDMQGHLNSHILSLASKDKWGKLVESLESESIHRLAVVPSDGNAWKEIQPYEAKLVSLGRTKFSVLERNEKIQNALSTNLGREMSDMYDPTSLAAIGKWLGVQAIVWVDVHDHWVKVLNIETAGILFQDRLLP